MVLLIRAELRTARRQIYLLKPVATLLVIALALSAPGPWDVTGYPLRVLLGLLLCLGGDVALMFQDRRRPFLLGLVMFLAGHIAYTAAFAVYARPAAPTLWSIAALLAVGLVFYRLIATGLGTMRGPVVLYILVISLMVAAAASLGGDRGAPGALAGLALGGALLFYLSDLMLAANRFWRPWRYNRLSLAFYYSGQVLIALSAHHVAS